MRILELQKQIEEIKKENFEDCNFAIITNVCFEPYLGLFLKKVFVEDKHNPALLQIQYEDYKSQLEESNIEKINLFIIYLDFDLFANDVINDIACGGRNSEMVVEQMFNLCEKMYTYLKSNYEVPIIWFGFEDYCYNYRNVFGCVSLYGSIVDKINSMSESLILSPDILINTKEVIAKIGIGKAYDNASKYRWSAPYSKVFVEEMAGEIHKQWRIQNNMTKKCIILDCDNVLWGGVLSEDGAENIALGSSGLGRSFYDFQKFLLTLYYHGVILTICSRNDLSDVMKVFEEHSGMILREEHISCFQVNWENKVDNIRKISENLNIDLNSMVFIDDSNFEIEAVRQILPEVTALLYDRDLIYLQLTCFCLKKEVNLEIVSERVKTYKTNLLRKELFEKQNDFESYLEVLEMNIDIHLAKEMEINRVAELSQRTNKRTNGIRYTLSQLREKVKEDSYKLYVVLVADKFSNLGLVGAIGVDDRTLDLFCLSCRALGRGIEDRMLNLLIESEINNVLFKDTGKNQDLKIMLDKIDGK